MGYVRPRLRQLCRCSDTANSQLTASKEVHLKRQTRIEDFLEHQAVVFADKIAERGIRTFGASPDFSSLQGHRVQVVSTELHLFQPINHQRCSRRPDLGH